MGFIQNNLLGGGHQCQRMGYILCTRVATYIWINHKSKFSILCFLPVKFFVSNSHCPYGYIWILLTRRLSCICKRGNFLWGKGVGGSSAQGVGKFSLGAGQLAQGVGKFSVRAGKLSLGVGKFNFGAGKSTQEVGATQVRDGDSAQGRVSSTQGVGATQLGGGETRFKMRNPSVPFPPTLPLMYQTRI